MRSERYIKALHSSTAAVTFAIVAVLGIVTGHYLLPAADIPSVGRTMLPAAGLWISSSTVALWANLVVTAGIAFFMYMLSREYKLTRESSSMLIAGLFMLMQMSQPALAASFTGGTLMAAVILACMAIMFGAYNVRECSIHVFSIFLLIGAGSLTCYGYLLYVPVFLAGCAQMRILSTRTMLAALLGLITPVWILAGFGIIDISAASLPQITTVISGLQLHNGNWISMLAMGFTIAVCLICGMGCIMRTYGYNSRIRSMNGFIYLITLATILYACIDFGSIALYIPTLDCCAAYQAAHFFIINKTSRSLPGAIFIILAYPALCLLAIMQ